MTKPKVRGNFFSQPKMKSRPNAFAPLGLGILVLSQALHAASLTALGVLPAGSPASYANAVTPDGRFVAGYSKSGSGTEAFRWSSAEGMVGLGELPGGEFYSEARAISSDGSTIVGASASGRALAYEAFVWNSGTLQSLTGTLPSGYYPYNALAMSPDGQTVVGSAATLAPGSRAYRWTATEGYALLPHPAGSSFTSTARAVSADGNTVAGILEYPDFSTEGFRWTPTTGIVSLGRLAAGKAVQSEVYDMSDDGRFFTGLLVYRESGNIEMMRWSAEEGLVPLGHLPKGESRSIGYGISEDGQTIVGEAIMEVIQPGFPFPLRVPRAAVWQQGIGLKPLWDLLVERGMNPANSGWNALVSAQAVSGNGRFIVGQGQRNGRSEAFLVDLATRLEVTGVVGDLRLQWPSGHKLQRTASLSPASWNDVPDAASPWNVPTDSEPGYFRIVSLQ